MIDTLKAKALGLIVECYAPITGATMGKQCETTCSYNHVHKVEWVLDGDLMAEEDGYTRAFSDALEDAFNTAMEQAFPEYEAGKVNAIYRQRLIDLGYGHVLRPQEGE